MVSHLLKITNYLDRQLINTAAGCSSLLHITLSPESQTTKDVQIRNVSHLQKLGPALPYLVSLSLGIGGDP